jgi:serine protease
MFCLGFSGGISLSSFHVSLRGLLGLVCLACLLSDPANANGLKRQVPPARDVPALQTAAPTGCVIIKFTEQSQLVVRESGLAGGKAEHLARVRGLLADKSGQVALERHFDQSFETLADLRQKGEARVHRSLPDLNAYGVLDYSHRATDRDWLVDLVKALVADPAVETAFLEPRPVPAALGFDAFTGTFTAPEREPLEQPLLNGDNRDTPDYMSQQGYLMAPPAGVNALAVESMPGGRGSTMQMIDVELGWNFSHEDLTSPFFTRGNITSTLDLRNHGTAVLGEIRGNDNGMGVRGIVPDAGIGASSAYGSPVSSAILYAGQALQTGDAILIELHAPGPNADGNGQFGYVPMEYWQDNFDAIQVVTANGLVVCEAAGNGSQDLDDPVYGVIFDREWRDSGAIMCGAANSSGIPYSWSNHGSRVDLNGWGGNVVTCGYGDLQGNPDFPEDQFYTSFFSGTSSASPIVTGSVMALQGLTKAAYGGPIDAFTMRTLLAETGTPQQPGSNVGSRPDILAAFQNLEWGLGEISGTVTDAVTGLPIADALVVVEGTSHSTWTDAEGMYSLVISVGPQNLSFSQFFYQEAQGSREIVYDNPAILDVAMSRLPAVDIRAEVRTVEGAPLTAGRLTALDVPLTAEPLPDRDGFIITGAPVGRPLQLRIDGEPYHGVDLVDLTPTASVTGYNFIYPELDVADHDFEIWWQSYTSQYGDFTWGEPVDAPVAFSGQKCWGVGMDGQYSPNTTDYLTSGPSNFFGTEELFLSLHYWCDLEDGVDGVSLQIQSTNNTWVNLEPLGGYSHDLVSSLGNAPGWSGTSDGWQGAVFDIQEFTLQPIVFRFKFTSDSSVQGAGFFLDDVTFDTGNSLSPVPEQGSTPALGRASLTAHPNPFNPRTTIDWEISRPGPVTVRIFDTRGRLVRVLLDEESSLTSGQLVWDGTGDQGRALSSGTYLVQVKDSSGQANTRRVTLIK